MYEHKKWDIALILKQLNRMEVCPFAAFLHMIYLTTIFHTLNISDVTNVPQQKLDRFPSVHIEVTTCNVWYNEDGLHLGTYLQLCWIVVQVRSNYKQMLGSRKFRWGVERDSNHFSEWR